MAGLLVIILYLLKRVHSLTATTDTALERWRGRPSSPFATATPSHVSCALPGGRGMGRVALLSGSQSMAGALTGTAADGPVQLWFFENRYGAVEFKSRSRTVCTLGQTSASAAARSPRLSTWPVCPQVGGDTPTSALSTCGTCSWAPSGAGSVLAWHPLPGPAPSWRPAPRPARV